ncbi:Hpt domain-containing protein [Vibrio apostichopi]|uniref:Hpt domain-containing protein n=1 Tax=Vibrio apostichopi TaxID=3035453 RepID=UPI0025726741|nr:Hpt domain-containing protein [Vibrio sp. FE10]
MSVQLSWSGRIMMYVIDENLFTKAIGVSYQSPQGKRFRQIAIRSLQKVEQDIAHNQESTKHLAHRIRGIALSCGVVDIGRICSKIELYDSVISDHLAQKALKDSVNILIHLCEE